MQNTKHEMDFDRAAFALQVLAQGAFIDAGCGPQQLYQVEAITVRLNPGALNTWLFNHRVPDRDEYETAEKWEAAKLEKAKTFEAWTKNVVSALGLEGFAGSIHISRATSEIFTVVHIQEITVQKERRASN